MTRKFQFLVLIVFIVLLLSSSQNYARSLQPEPAMTLYGYVFIRTVTDQNITAPEGLRIYAKVDNETLSNSTTATEGRYVLLITDQEDGTFVDIWVQDVKVANITFRSWNVTWLNLTAVDMLAPRINPLYPITGAILLGNSIQINASIYDNLAINQSAVSMMLNHTKVTSTYYPEKGLVTYEAENVDQGFYVINVTVSDLSENIAYEIWNFSIIQPTSPLVEILNPTTENPVYTRSGKTLPVIYNYTELNPTEATIKIFNATQVIEELLITPSGGTNIQRNDTVLVKEATSDDKYTLDITIYNIYNLNQTAVQPDAIIVDNTSPLIQDVRQNPPAYAVQPNDQVQVNATVRDMLSGINEVNLLWRIEDSEWNNVRMNRIEEDTYNGVMPAFENCTIVYYKIEAIDKAGNYIAEDNAGEFYTYHVIPEFPSTIIMIFLFASLSILVIIKKHAHTRVSQL